MTSPLQQDLHNLATLLERAKVESLAHLESLDTLPTTTTYSPQTAVNQLANEGMGAIEAMDLFND